MVSSPGHSPWTSPAPRQRSAQSQICAPASGRCSSSQRNSSWARWCSVRPRPFPAGWRHVAANPIASLPSTSAASGTVVGLCPPTPTAAISRPESPTLASRQPMPSSQAAGSARPGGQDAAPSKGSYIHSFTAPSGASATARAPPVPRSTPTTTGFIATRPRARSGSPLSPPSPGRRAAKRPEPERRRRQPGRTGPSPDGRGRPRAPATAANPRQSASPQAPG